MKTIKVKIGVDGKPVFEVSGVTGSACESLTASFEERLGRVIEAERKPEFYQHAEIRALAKT